MKRAIYVGKTGFSGMLFLSYGMTGEYCPERNRLRLDGQHLWQIYIPQNQIHQLYIPSEDQQRHCPKP